MIKNWLEKTIIGLDLCPFARRPYLEGKLLIENMPASETTEAQLEFLTTLNIFQAQSKFETALIIYPNWKCTFEDFYYFVEDCEDHLVSLNLQDEFQLVAFHPGFRFQTLDFSDRANLVNSSPLPLIHVLRINDLELLNLSHEDAEAMSFANAKKLQTLTDEQLLDHFPWR